MVSDIHKVMGSLFSIPPPPNLLDENYNHSDMIIWRVQKENLPKSSGGPLDLGDPYDRSLSEAEVKIIIPRFEKARNAFKLC